MKTLNWLIIGLSFIICSCNKGKPDSENVVVYTVVETSNNTPEFNVIYSTPQGDKTDGIISQNSWLSKQLPDFKRGDYVSLTIETKSGTGSFISSVYLNGVLVKEEKMDYPFLKKLEAVLPPAY